jgi:hypothetical protein
MTSTTTVSTTKSLVFATTFTARETPSSPVTIIVQPPPTTTTITPPTIQVSTPVETIQISDIKTFTHVDATYYFANADGFVTSSYTTEFLYGPDPGPGNSASKDDDDSDFNSWSTGAKVGLIVGVVLAGMILIWMCMCCYKRNTAWVAHDWRWAGAVEGRP